MWGRHGGPPVNQAHTYVPVCMWTLSPHTHTPTHTCTHAHIQAHAKKKKSRRIQSYSLRIKNFFTTKAKTDARKDG